MRCKIDRYYIEIILGKGCESVKSNHVKHPINNINFPLYKG